MEWFTNLPWILQALITVIGVLVCLALLGRKTGISKMLHQRRMRNIAVQEELRYKQRDAGRELTKAEKEAVRKDTEAKWNERYAR